MSTILVVDDMPIFRDPIAASLRLAGFATVCAANGRDALAAAAAHRPDVILLDVAMPVMDGIACLRALRAHAELAKTPVILLTAMTDKRYVVEAGKLGVQDYLLKSAFSMQELLTRVCKYVEKPMKPAGKPGTKSELKSNAETQAGAAPGAKPQAAGTATAPKSSASKAPVGSPAIPARAATSPSPKPIATPPAPPPASVTAPPVPAAPRGGVAAAAAASVPRLLTREQCLARAEKAMGAKTLSGAVADVIRLAASPRSNVNDLAPLISRDALLSARVLQAANSATYVSSRGVVSTIPDAVRQVGTSTVRQIASALGIFDAMPPSEPDGFNPIRCWQHSFAVAMLCERLALCQKENARDAAGAHPPAVPPGIAYLVGLCHDLGEILFHTQFAREYAQVLEVQAAGGRGVDDVERQMLGITRGELVQTIVKCLGLPEQIKEPIGAFHGTSDGGAGGAVTPLLRVLKAAEFYANGLLLASSLKAPVAPLTRAECRAAVGRDDPPAPDVTVFRSEVLYTTGMLARLSQAEAEEVMRPQFGRSDAKLWVVRESSLSTLDPVTAALESLAHVTPRERLPEAADADGIDGMVVLAPSDLSSGLTGADIAKALATLGKPVPVLWLVARAMFTAPPSPRGRPQAPSAQRWPVGIDRLAAFVDTCRPGAAGTSPAVAA